MARTEMIRYICNYCLNSQDMPSAGMKPAGWKQFASRQLEPTESETSIIIDLCPEHAADFQDFLYSKNGTHRAKAHPVAEPVGNA